MDTEDLETCLALLTAQRWAALATSGAQGPLASMVAFAVDWAGAGVLMHLSTLAAHTRNLQATPRGSLVVSEPDRGSGDPQELARLTLTGPVGAVPAGDPGYGQARECYLQRFPAAARRFGFTDFGLYRLAPERASFVGGFARARTLDGRRLLADLAALEAPPGST